MMILAIVMDAKIDQEISNEEEDVFKALDHQIRRDVLRYIGEAKEASFTETLNKVRIQDSPTLSYHLKIMSPLLSASDGRYSLSPVGKSAYSLLLKTADYNRQALFMRRKTEAIIGHVVLWISAMAAGLVMGVDTFMTAIILPSLAAASLMIIEKLFE